MSYCEDYNEIHFCREEWIIATFNVISDNVETKIYGNGYNENDNIRDYFSKIEIDGVEINLNDLPA